MEFRDDILNEFVKHNIPCDNSVLHPNNWLKQLENTKFPNETLIFYIVPDPAYEVNTTLHIESVYTSRNNLGIWMVGSNEDKLKFTMKIYGVNTPEELEIARGRTHI